MQCLESSPLGAVTDDDHADVGVTERSGNLQKMRLLLHLVKTAYVDREKFTRVETELFPERFNLRRRQLRWNRNPGTHKIDRSTCHIPMEFRIASDRVRHRQVATHGTSSPVARSCLPGSPRPDAGAPGLHVVQSRHMDGPRESSRYPPMNRSIGRWVWTTSGSNRRIRRAVRTTLRTRPA